jgi:hypothetical protein
MIPNGPWYNGPGILDLPAHPNVTAISSVRTVNARCWHAVTFLLLCANKVMGLRGAMSSKPVQAELPTGEVIWARLAVEGPQNVTSGGLRRLDVEDLAKINDPAAVPTFAEAPKDSDADVRSAAAQALPPNELRSRHV